MTRRSDPPRDPYTFYSRQCHSTTTSSSKEIEIQYTDRKTHRFGLPFFCQESVLYMTANFDPAAQSKKVCLFTVLVSLFYCLVLYVVSPLLLSPPPSSALCSASASCVALMWTCLMRSNYDCLHQPQKVILAVFNTRSLPS